MQQCMHVCLYYIIMHTLYINLYHVSHIYTSLQSVGMGSDALKLTEMLENFREIRIC